MRQALLLAILLTAVDISVAQTKVFNTHISTEDGLPQKTVMNIVQDSRGFMWFSTWNGICKYDGVNFYSYKVSKADSRAMHSNRFDGMWIDKFGYIWVNTYENQMYRFNPRTEKYNSLQTLDKFKGLNSKTQGIIISPSGKNWLLSQELGPLCFKDSLFNPLLLAEQVPLLKNNKVNAVYEDGAGNSWILSNKGIHCFDPNLKLLHSYYQNNKFYRALLVGKKIWFGADAGQVYVYDMACRKFTVQQTSAKASLRILKQIDNDKILLASADNDFLIFNRSNNRFQSYSLTQFRPTTYTEIRSCYIDHAANIWFETNGTGVSRFSPQTGTFKHIEPERKPGPKDPYAPRFYIWEDKDYRLWVQTVNGGLELYDAVNDDLKPLDVPGLTGPGTPLLLHAGFSDKQGNLWISTRKEGLNKIQFGNNGFTSEIVDPQPVNYLNNEVRSIMEDHRGHLWVATKAGKVFVYNAKHQQIGYLTNTGKISKQGTELDGMSYAITEDGQHRIWLGTKGKGLYKLTPNPDSVSYTVMHYQRNGSNAFSLSDDRVYAVHADRKHNRIWVGTYGGGLNLLDDRVDGRFYHSGNLMHNYPGSLETKARGYRVRSLGTDTYGNLYIGTASGLFVTRPNYNDVKGMRFQLFERSPAEGSLAGNDIFDIYTTRNGTTYIASFGGGLNKVTARTATGIPLKFQNYTMETGLSSDLVQQIEEDNNGKIWVATEATVSRFDPERELFETYHDINRLLKGDILSEGGSTRTRGGLIMMGYAGGLITIDPAKLISETSKPYVAITGFRIANQRVPVSDSTVLQQSVDYLKRIELTHRQNFLSFEFAALDMKNTRHISYAYRLDGIDTAWVYTHQREASYSNLSPGKYTFRVRSNNGYGLWLDNEHRIDIEIRPAIWQTWWAMVLYVVAATLTAFFGLRWVYRYFRLKDRLALEQEQLEMKTNFFTDVSHEIRTPLTMIVSPLEGLLEHEDVTPKVKENLQLMHKNATRMLRLVNQVLDFRKIESQLLIVREVNIGNLVKDIAASFKPVATMGNISLEVNNQAADRLIWADKESLEKLVYNLLSNALKNTSAGDVVTVELSMHRHELMLQVSDTGRGMSNELLSNLFTRFLSHNPNKSQPGTGIGLSIVKEIVDRHHARITVDSSERVGSEFTIFFQCGDAHFKDDCNVVVLKNDLPVTDLALTTNAGPTLPAAVETEKSAILVLEDDDDLRNYLTNLLQPQYIVSQAANGIEGLAKAQAEMPDFILSDLMMAGMDGLTFLKELRASTATSHIPVVFLTAKADQETEMLAYQNGADAFITKPFSTKVLQLRIKTIIEQRKRLNQSLIFNLAPPAAAVPSDMPKLTKQDELFLNKVRADIEKHIADAHYSVENLISIMPMSRTVFVKKLKSLTAQSPVEFIRYIKIHHAARLMETENYSIKEISHLVGIADTKYFAQRFKEVMGVMPSEYKNRFKHS